MLCRGERLDKKRQKATKDDLHGKSFPLLEAVVWDKTCGTLSVEQEVLERHLMGKVSDANRAVPAVLVPYLFRPGPPELAFRESPVTWKQVQGVIRNSITCFVGCPHGVRYAVYKRYPKLLMCLWRILMKIWEVSDVPECSCRADGVYIPKEENLLTFGQFCPMSHVIFEGNVFFNVLARRLTSYSLWNNYIVTTIQKVGFPGFLGCLEHVSMI